MAEMQTHFSFTTKKAAAVAGIKPHVLLNHHQRYGHYLGVTPRQLPSRHLRWPAVEFYRALGKLPPALRQSPAEKARDFTCQHTRTDPFQAQQVFNHLFCESPKGDRPAGRFEYLEARAAHLISHAEAVAGLARETMSGEEHLNTVGASRLHSIADRLIIAVEAAVTPLRWVAAPPTPIVSYGRIDTGVDRE